MHLMPHNSRCTCSEFDHLRLENAGDEELFRSLQGGCDRCFDILFARYWRLVLALAWKIVRERSAAEDVVQEVFLTIYLKRDLYDPARGSIKTWIAQFAHFKAMLKRRQMLAREMTILDEVNQFDSEHSGVSTQQEILERAALVEECLSSLNARQRRAIELVHFDGYTLLETAGILGQSLANTRNIYYRGIKALRLYLVHAGATRKKADAGTAIRFPGGSGEPLVLEADA
jgi:RNA polymerase sigma factor (sigma-70 family)